MRKVITITILIFYSSISMSQELKGKWLMMKDGDTYSVPTIPILEFTNNTINFYDFDEPDYEINQNTYVVKGDYIEIKRNAKEEKERFEFLEENVLKIYHNVIYNERDTVLPSFYVRVLPTKTTLKKEEIEEDIYSGNFNNKKIEIKFRRKIEGYLAEVKKESKSLNYLKNEFFIEKLDDTFVVSSYGNGKRELILLIDEVDSESIILSGFIKKPYRFKLNKIAD